MTETVPERGKSDGMIEDDEAQLKEAALLKAKEDARLGRLLCRQLLKAKKRLKVEGELLEWVNENEEEVLEWVNENICRARAILLKVANRRASYRCLLLADWATREWHTCACHGVRSPLQVQMEWTDFNPGESTQHLETTHVHLVR